jgi:carbohydrate kinase (thermoresistant glucokinase family)
MIVLVAGVSGSGKTTVGTLLAARLGWPFADGDSFHPAGNVAKMRAGLPLTDADRRPWLAAMGAWMDERTAAGQSAVLACSALKRSYRAALLAGRPAARMAFLQVSHDQDAARLSARHGHFFPAKLLDSQFAVLEMPEDSKRIIVVPAHSEPATVVADIMARLGLADDRPPGTPVTRDG